MRRPIYTPRSCEKRAYQLDWSLSIFWRTTPDPDTAWGAELQQQVAKDGIRILQHQFEPPNISKFLISTPPEIAPARIVQRVKGRLAWLLGQTTKLSGAACPCQRGETRDHQPSKRLRGNYCIRGIGSTRRARLDQYLAGQLEHHPMVDRRVQCRLKQFQIHRPEVDLAAARRTSHGQFWYNLHIVLVYEGRHCQVDTDLLQSLHDMILAASEKKRHLLSRAALPSDHIHLTLGCHLHESPEEVVLSYMNNLAYAVGERPIFRFSYYVGTFSEYDLRVIPRL